MSQATKPPVPPAECADLAQMLETKYGAYLGNRTFIITSEMKDGGVFVTVLLKNPDDTFYYPVEARMNHVAQELLAKRAGVFLIDYIDAYFEEYFTEEDENLFLPIDWADMQWDTVDFQIRGQILNLKVERMADALLTESPSEVIQ